MKQAVKKVFKTVLILLAVSQMGIGAAGAEKIRLYASGWSVNELLRGMKKLGQLDEFELIHDKFETCIYKLKKGEADIVAGMTLFEFIASQHESQDIVLIAVMDYSAGGDVMILRPEIRSASDLKGKIVGVQANCVSIQFLDLYLKKNGMSLNDIRIAHIPVENVAKAYASGTSLAGIAGGGAPLSDEAVGAGGRIVATSKDFPEKIIDGFAVNRKSLQKNREVYKIFLKKWFAAVRDPAVAEKSAEDLKIPPDEFKKWLETTYIYQDAASSLGMFPKAKEVTRELQEFFKTVPAGLPPAAARLFGKEPLNADSWFDDSLLRELLKE